MRVTGSGHCSRSDLAQVRLNLLFSRGCLDLLTVSTSKVQYFLFAQKMGKSSKEGLRMAREAVAHRVIL